MGAINIKHTGSGSDVTLSSDGTALLLDGSAIGGVSWTAVSNTYTATSKEYLLANTAGGAFTVTLPATPSSGDFVVIADAADFSANNVTVDRNGSTIENLANNFVLDIQHVRVDFVYDSSTWQVFPTINAANRPTIELENVGTITSSNLDLSSGNVFSDTPSSNTTYGFNNPPSSGTAYGFTLKVTPSATVTLTWPASVDWPGGTAPDAPSSGETDVFTFYTQDGGTTYYGFQAGDAMS